MTASTKSSSAPISRQDAALTTPGLRRRMACWVYEGLLLFAVVFVSGWLFSTLGQMRNAMDDRRSLLQAFLFVVFGVYFTWFWARGQTLAMKTWNIRVVDVHGQAVTQKRAFLRYLLSWLWFMPSLAAVYFSGIKGAESVVIVLGWVSVWAVLSRFHPTQQFWHDALAGTRLVTSLPLSR